MADFKTMQNTILATFPGLPVQIVSSFINTTYRELLRCWEWAATLQSFTLPTVIGQSIYVLNATVIEMYNIVSDVKLSEVDIDFLDRLDPERTSTGTPLYYTKFGKIGGSLRIILYPTPSVVETLTYSARIATVDLSASTDVPLLDSDLIVKGAMMYLCPVYARMGHPDVLKESPMYRQQFVEAKNDAMMEDMRNQSTAKKIRDVYGSFGSGYSDNFRQSHDVD